MKSLNVGFLLLAVLFSFSTARAQVTAGSEYFGTPILSIPNPTVTQTAVDDDDWMMVQTEGGTHTITARLVTPLPSGWNIRLQSSGPLGSKGSDPTGDIASLQLSDQVLFEAAQGAESFDRVDLVYTLTVPAASSPDGVTIWLQVCINKNTGQSPTVFCQEPTEGTASVGVFNEVRVYDDLATSFQPKPDHPDVDGGFILTTVGTATLEWQSSGPDASIKVQKMQDFPWDVEVEIANVSCSTVSCGDTAGSYNIAEGYTPVLTNVNGSGTAEIRYMIRVPVYERSQSNQVNLEYVIE